MVYDFLVVLLAGLGAGVVTGLFGASAVMIAASLMILFLNFNPYYAIGISLAIDVFASFSALIVYRKHKNVHLSSALWLLIPALIFVLVGSYLSSYVNPVGLSGATSVGIFIVGVLFYRKSILKKKKHDLLKIHGVLKKVFTVFIGILIGLIAGVFGAGGGVMIVGSLVLLLDYKLHRAIGTSVLMMIFIALFGALGHYYYIPFSFYHLVVGVIGGVLGAVYSAKLANLTDEKILMRWVAFVFMAIGILLFLKGVVL